MPNQPRTPRPNITIEISNEHLQHYARGEGNLQIRFFTDTDINLAVQQLRAPDIQVSFNITNDLREFGSHQATDAERARGDVYFQVRVVGPPSTDIQHGTHVHLNEPDRRPPRDFTVARLLGFLPTLRLDALAEDKKNCPVCTEPFSLDDRPTLLECNHLIGRECIQRWVLSGHNSCPICRAAIVRLAD